MYIKPFLIHCPISLKTDFAAPDRDFEQYGDDNYLKLLIERSNYRVNKNYASGTPQYTRSLTTATVQFKAYYKQLEIKVADERSHLLDVLSEISKTSFSADKRTQTPVKVVDYVLPEADDIKAARGWNIPPRTVRYGLLKDIQPNGGAVGGGIGQELYIKDGFSFRFEELLMRQD